MYQGPTRTTSIQVRYFSHWPLHITQCPITDSQLDSYKHGAFLEKTDRFTETKPSDVSGELQCSCRSPYPIFLDTLEGPDSYPQPDHGATNKQPAKRVATNERYATLQRQVEELERMHAESRKTVRAPFKKFSHFDFLT